ncbi:MAG: hypothetical protein M3N14_10265, partial [Bacteroidota bacterium]|nr:hypothetical protein [Bacteroidota bacterium]
MFRILSITALICCVTISFAQDTTKKVHTVKPINKYKSYKYYPHRPYKAKKDTGTVKPGTKPAATTAIRLRRDTTTLPAAPMDKTLNGQYQFLLSRVYHYQQPLLISTWKSAIDTLNLNKRMLKDAQGKLTFQGKLIDSLKKDANDKAQSLNTS